jgi:hypothetical protein
VKIKNEKLRMKNGKDLRQKALNAEFRIQNAGWMKNWKDLRQKALNAEFRI